MMFSRLSRAAAAIFLLALGSSGALAAPVSVTLSNNPTTCSPVKITWDTSAGTAPWTVTVAPLGHVPISVSLPANYMTGNSWSWDWNVPGYSSVSSVIVAVSDSKGAATGTSALTRLGKAGSCSAPPEHLDFVWYPPTSDPHQCDDWRLTVQEDHGNLGLKMPVDMLIMPENEEPTRLRITDNRQSSVDWTVNYARGTRFAIASFDAGSSGTGGVGGDIYAVGAGRSNGCINRDQREAVAGLPAASSTATPLAATTSTTAPSRMATSRISHTTTGSAAKSTPTTPTSASNVDATSSDSGPSSGVIGGAIGGVLGALALGGLAYFLYRRKRTSKGPDEYGVYASNEKRSIFGSGRSADRNGFTGRGGASTDQQGGISPFVTGRASPWRWSSRPVQDERRRMNDMGRSSSISLGRESVAGQSLGGKALSIHSIVPDDALFPPPPPMPVPRMVPGMGGQWNGEVRQDPFRNPVEKQAALPPLPPPQQVISRESPRAAQPNLPPHQPSSAPPQQAAFRNSPRTLPSNLPHSAPPQDLNTAFIPPPAPLRTSIFDPYSHASHLYTPDEVYQLNNALAAHERADAATPTSTTSSARYADPKESAARFKTLETQLRDERKKVVSMYEEDSDDEGLPYM